MQIKYHLSLVRDQRNKYYITQITHYNKIFNDRDKIKL